VSIEQTKAIYLIKLLEILRENSLCVETVLNAAGLQEFPPADHDADMPLSQYLEGVEEAVCVCAIPDLGFLVGEKTTPLEHGVLGYALLSSPTLRDCLDRYVRFQYLQGTVMTVYLSDLC
jgi:hypothetical protein